MTCTSTKTLRRRRVVAAALSLPLALAMTGTAFATGTTELRTTAAVASGADRSDAAAANAAAARAAEDKAAADKGANDKAANDKAASDKAAADKAAARKADDDKPAPAPAPKADKPTSTGSAAGAASGKSAAETTRDSSANPDKHGTATEAPLTKPQPLSGADKNGTGANPGDPCKHVYCSTRDGSPSLNGNGGGEAKGKPCAGCVGKADNKNPPGQEQSKPRDTFPNNGYECDNNNGIGKTNPAHTGCTDSGTSPTTPPAEFCPGTTIPLPAGGAKNCPGGGGGDKKFCPGTTIPLPAGGAKDCPGGNGGGGGSQQITICHATGAGSKFVTISPSDSGVLNGHLAHQDGRDVIPAFSYVDKKTGKTVSFPGQPVGATAATVAAGCGSAVDDDKKKTCPDGSAMPASGDVKDCAKKNDDVKTCPNGSAMPASGDVKDCTTPIGGTPPGQPVNNPPADVCPEVPGMQEMGPCTQGPVVTPPPAGEGGGAPIGGVTPPQAGSGPVPPGLVPPVIVPNNNVAPAVLGGVTASPATRPATAAAPRALPFTGAEAALLVELAALLLLAGGGFMLVARRNRIARAA